MKVSFVIHTPHYRYITDKIVAHLKCSYEYHTTFEQVFQYKPDVVVCGLHYKQLDSKNFVSVYTGHGLSWASGLYGKDNIWHDYVLAMSEFIKNEILRMDGSPKKEIWTTGWPTTDNLFTRKVKPAVFNKFKGPFILYAPTSNPSSYPYLTNIHKLVPKDTVLIIKPHPVPGIDAGEMARKHTSGAVNVYITDYHDNPNDYIPHVDLIITDKSSVLFYPLAMPEKPVIQCVFPNLLENWKKYPKSYDCIEYKWRDAWKQVGSGEELKKAVMEELGDPMRNYKIRKNYGDILFGDLRDGQSGKRVAEKIMQLGGTK